MIADYVLPKPHSTSGYAVHRMVEGLTAGARPLFTDMGDRLWVRSGAPITGTQVLPVPALAVSDIAAFQLRACVSKKTKGKRSYYPTGDWLARHQWLQRQGPRHGFEVLTVHCTAGLAKIAKTDGAHQDFTVDRTDFTGVLKVIDADKFQIALSTGIGACARAFGFGMLII